MDKKLILEKAIEKAIKNKWKWYEEAVEYYKPIDVTTHIWPDPERVQTGINFTFNMKDESKTKDWSVKNLLFDHDFAKAFFGTTNLHRCGGNIKTLDYFVLSEKSSNDYCEKCDRGFDNQQERYFDEEDLIPAWEFYLQQMVLSEDPISYLSQFVE